MSEASMTTEHQKPDTNPSKLGNEEKYQRAKAGLEAFLLPATYAVEQGWDDPSKFFLQIATAVDIAINAAFVLTLPNSFLPRIAAGALITFAANLGRFFSDRKSTK